MQGPYPYYLDPTPTIEFRPGEKEAARGEEYRLRREEAYRLGLPIPLLSERPTPPPAEAAPSAEEMAPSDVSGSRRAMGFTLWW